MDRVDVPGAGAGAEDEMVRVWGRLTAWLQEHAPATAAAVLPPAGPGALTLAERSTSFGTSWPAEVQAFYRLCDGTDRAHGTSFLPGVRVFPLFDPEHGTAVVETWRSIHEHTYERAAQEAAAPVDPREENLRRMAGLDPTPPPRWDPAPLEAQPAGTEAGMWLPSWLPIAEDLSGSLMVVDRRDGPHHGCLLHVDKVDCDHQAERWPSLTALLTAVLDALTTGAVLAGARWRAEVVDDVLTWERVPRSAVR